MSKMHFIFDYETTGQNVFSCAVVDCSYIAFDWDRFTTDPYLYEDLLSFVEKDKLNVTDQVSKYGWKVEKDFVENFLKKLPADVKKNFYPSPHDVTVEHYLERMVSYAEGEKIKYWWSRANTFDPIILDRMLHVVDPTIETRKNKALAYWKVRDTRTFINAKTNFNMTTSFVPMKDEEKWKDTFKAHNSAHDIVADILRMQAITRIESDLDLPE